MVSVARGTAVVATVLAASLPMCARWMNTVRRQWIPLVEAHCREQQALRTRRAGWSGHVLLLGLVLGLPVSAAAADYTFQLFPNVPGEVLAFNDVGAMVGVTNSSATGLSGFLADGASVTMFKVPGEDTVAYGINNRGQIVGCAGDSGFLTQNLTDFVTLLFPGSTGTCAFAINDHGHVVGTYTAVDGSGHGFIYDGVTWLTIDHPGGANTDVYDINNNGTIVGATGDFSALSVTGFLRTASGTFTTIAVPGATYVEAQGINDAGQVIVYAFGSDINTHFVKVGDTLEALNYPGYTFANLTDINNGGQVVGNHYGFHDPGNPPFALNFVATPESPFALVVPNATSFAAGQTLVLRLNVRNPSAHPPLDLYVGALWPDGNTIAFLAAPNTLGGLGQFSTPASVAPMSMVEGGAAINTVVLEYLFPASGIPVGTYYVFASLFRHGSLADNVLNDGDLVWLDFFALSFVP